MSERATAKIVHAEPGTKQNENKKKVMIFSIVVGLGVVLTTFSIIAILAGRNISSQSVQDSQHAQIQKAIGFGTGTFGKEAEKTQRSADNKAILGLIVFLLGIGSGIVGITLLFIGSGVLIMHFNRQN